MMIYNLPLEFTCERCGALLETQNVRSTVGYAEYGVNIIIKPCAKCMEDTHKNGFEWGKFAERNNLTPEENK